MGWKETLARVKGKVFSSNGEQEIDTTVTAESVIKTIEQFMNLLSNIESQFNFNAEQVTMTDNETQDLLHEIELTTFNAAKGYLLVRDLKKVRCDRRYYKDQDEILHYMVKYLRDNPTTKDQIENVLYMMKQRKQKQLDRQYTPKIREDLSIGNNAAC